jgi:hypothetical protein
MRKVILTMNKEKRFEIIKKLVDTNGNKKNAALKLSCTERHINRMITGYKRDGKSYFIHGDRGPSYLCLVAAIFLFLRWTLSISLTSMTIPLFNIEKAS